MTRQEQKEQRRQQILDASRDVFAEKGYHAATIDDIAARVQISRGTFYLYYDDKRAVFGVLVDSFFERIAGSIKSIDLSDDAPAPRAQLRANIERMTHLALSEPAMTKIALHDTTGVDPAFDEKLKAFYSALSTFLHESLEEGQRIGLIRDGDRAVITAIGLGALRQILLDAVSGNMERSVEEITGEMLTFLERGLLT